MPTTQELKRVWEELDAQIVAAEQEEREAEEARLWAEEEAGVATEKAWLEEEEREWERVLEQARQAEEAWAWAEEEAQRQEEERRVREEEDRLVVERDLREEKGPSRERAPWQRLFLPSSDSARSPEEEEGVEGPSQDKGKGRALASEEVRGEVTGVVCNLCDKKGIPCWWGMVSIP